LAERKWVLTKIGAGDYLLPSNDRQTLWRIARGDEQAGAEGLRIVSVWQVWRYAHATVGPGASTPEEIAEDVEDWSNWTLEASWCETRAEAIAEALRM